MAAAVVMCILGTVATFFVLAYIVVEFNPLSAWESGYSRLGIDSLKDDKARLTNEIASLRSTVTQQRREIDDQRVRLQESAQEKTRLTANLEAEQARFTDEIASLKNTIAELQSDQEKTRLTARLQEKEDEIASLRLAIAKLQSKSDQEKTRLTARLQEKADETASLRLAIAELQKKENCPESGLHHQESNDRGDESETCKGNFDECKQFHGTQRKQL